jgi:hypothetical protein
LHPLEAGSKRGSIVIMRDVLMHRDQWVNSKDILRIEKNWRLRTLYARSLQYKAGGLLNSPAIIQIEFLQYLFLSIIGDL